jgi:hypothetical protein
MSFSPWSISKAQIAYGCTLRFNHMYVQRTPKKKGSNQASRIGSAVHLLLEYMLDGRTFEDGFRAGAMKYELTHKELLEFKTFRAPVRRFMDKFAAYKEKFDVEEILLERKVAVDENLEIVENFFDNEKIYFRGVIDLGVLIRRGDKRYLVIIDHKSGEPKDISEYMDQLNGYLVVATAMYPDIAGAQAAIHWLRAEEALDQKVVEWTPMIARAVIDTKLLPWFHGYLGGAQTLGEEEPKPTAGWYCQFCEYRPECPLIT